MQRLTRMREDRGAVAVWVAIMMVPLLVMAALAIDIGAANSDRQRLQYGADAAALAVAQECAAGSCATATVTAQTLAEANAPAGGPVDATVQLFVSEGRVEVQTNSNRNFWFAPVIGEDGAALGAASAASWNQFPTGGSHLPLAISWCEVAYWAGLDSSDVIRRDGRVIGLNIPAERTGTELFSKGSNNDFHACPTGTNPNGPNGAAPPGGFGWLVTQGACRATTNQGGWFDSSTGRPSTCESLSSMIDETVLVPIYDQVRGQGSSGQYRVFGYIGFTLKGYRNNKGSAGTVPSSCSSSDDCIYGTIQRFVDLGGDFTTSPDGPQLGASVVQLQLPTGERP